MHNFWKFQMNWKKMELKVNETPDKYVRHPVYKRLLFVCVFVRGWRPNEWTDRHQIWQEPRGTWFGWHWPNESNVTKPEVTSQNQNRCQQTLSWLRANSKVLWIYGIPVVLVVHANITAVSFEFHFCSYSYFFCRHNLHVYTRATQGSLLVRITGDYIFHKIDQIESNSPESIYIILAKSTQKWSYLTAFNLWLSWPQGSDERERENDVF